MSETTPKDPWMCHYELRNPTLNQDERNALISKIIKDGTGWHCFFTLRDRKVNAEQQEKLFLTLLERGDKGDFRDSLTELKLTVCQKKQIKKKLKNLK